ncbi:MAG: ABC-type transport auxiliary lipoprotein family protein [Gammaproteobacteria bacterium]|nr:ABC-type transport auxiliary lipoprotein family protein [Gammaproteobacteria bacterium]
MKPGIGNRESGIGEQTRRLKPAIAVVLAVLLLGGCGLLGKKKMATIYAPDPRVQADPAWPSVQWQLSVSRPSSPRMLDSQRIAVRPVPGELQVYKGANWAKAPPDQVEDMVLRVLEDSGRIPAVARQGSGIAADYKLVMDLRRFEADYAGAAVPAATIDVSVKLLHAPDHDVVDARTFVQAVPADGTHAAQVSQAFEQALGRIGHDIAGWTLTTGQAHERMGPHPSTSKP